MNIFPSKRRTNTASTSAFLMHIPIVVDSGSEKQMIRTDAFRIVPSGAIVADEKIIGDRSEMNHPTKAVRHFVAAMHRASSDSSIALRGHVGAGEDPATVGFGDSAPETVKDVRGKSLSEKIRETINRFRHISLSIQRLIWLGVRCGCYRSDAVSF